MPNVFHYLALILVPRRSQEGSEFRGERERWGSKIMIGLNVFLLM